ncbi:MAG: hypothetical protein K1X65_25165 [Caldilineales bacterium]|nr:hypothetical protein [Caldilineales bacterium]MCW5861040.1 hypothetical protein [Caldilineales bacterium]
MMSETLAFSQSYNGRLATPLLPQTLKPQKVLQSARIDDLSLPSLLYDNEEKSRYFTFSDAFITQIENWLLEARMQVKTRLTRQPVVETPEVFNLRPLASQPVSVIIREVGPAQFYFVEESEWIEDPDE